MNKKPLILTVVVVITSVLFTFGIGMVQAQHPKPEIGAKQIINKINGERIFEFTDDRTSDEMMGRLAGTEGDYLAAEYISEKFEQWGLEPAGDDGTYYQSFDFPLWYTSAPVNLAVILVYAALRSRLGHPVSLANVLFFVVLLTLLVTLYDRYRQVYLMRFSEVGRSRWE